MTKGIRRELSMEEEVVELDRLLMASMRRILSLAEGLRKNTANGNGRAILERHLSRHALIDKKAPETAAEDSAPVSEADRRIRRFDRYLSALPEEDLQSVLELVKSMCRTRKGPAPKKPKSGGGKESSRGEGKAPEEQPS